MTLKKERSIVDLKPNSCFRRLRAPKFACKDQSLHNTQAQMQCQTSRGIRTMTSEQEEKRPNNNPHRGETGTRSRMAAALDRSQGNYRHSKLCFLLLEVPHREVLPFPRPPLHLLLASA